MGPTAGAARRAARRNDNPYNRASLTARQMPRSRAIVAALSGSRRLGGVLEKGFDEFVRHEQRKVFRTFADAHVLHR